MVVNSETVDDYHVGPRDVPTEFLRQPFQAQPRLVLGLGAAQARIASWGYHLIATELHRVAEAFGLRTDLCFKSTAIIEDADSHGRYATDPFLVSESVVIGRLADNGNHESFCLEDLLQTIDFFGVRLDVAGVD